MKTKLKAKYALLLSLGLFNLNTHAQQQVQFTQYMYNTMMVNPAYAGTGQPFEALVIHRSQWVGLDGAPQTQNFSAQGAIGKVLGLGLNVVNDKIGPSNQAFFTGAISARIKLSDNVRLSLGVNAGIDMVSVDWSKGQAQSQNDQAMNNNIRNRIRPVVGAGMYLYSKKWYVGVSAPTFLEKDSYTDVEEGRINNRMHFYGIAGYVFDVHPIVKLKPALMAKMVMGAPVTVDASLNVMLKDQFTIGAAYRYHDAVAILLGYTIKNQFFIGYSYDINVAKLRRYNSGSHDIILKYSLFRKTMEARSPRFF